TILTKQSHKVTGVGEDMAMIPAVYSTVKDVLHRCAVGPRRTSSLWSLMLVLMMLVAACAPAASPAASPTAAPAAGAAEEMAEATEGEEADSGADSGADTIKVGILHSL